MTGLQAQLATAGGTTIANGAPVIFNTVRNAISSNISYNSLTGEFTINTAGNYYITWWVAVNGTQGLPNIAFAIGVNGANLFIGNAPVATGQVTGNALLSLIAEPVTITLNNVSGGAVALASTEIQADIVFIKL